jgi:hypothetical protein
MNITIYGWSTRSLALAKGYPHHLCQMWLSVPSTNTSIRFGPQDTADGLCRKTPPRCSQPDQLFPFHHLCHRWLSVPLAKTSRRLFDQVRL